MTTETLQTRPKAWKLKGCPKCGGDLYMDWRLAGDRWMRYKCLQCGYEESLQEREPLRLTRVRVR